jgi:4-amino-4-deoxy-L-arabinose transferase-like glycosyltransferase
MLQIKDSNYIILVLALATMVRLASTFLFFGEYRPTQDAGQWNQAALNLLEGRGLIVHNDGKPYWAYRTPLPGLYIASIYSVFGVSVRAVQFANAFLGVFTVWLAYDLMRRSFGGASALAAANFISFYPLFSFYSGQMLSETPVIMLLALGLWLVWLVRYHAAIHFVTVGIVLGMAVLTREAIFAIAGLIAIWTFIVRRHEAWHRRCLPAVVILSFLALTVTPWALRNYVLFGKFVPLTSQGGFNLWIANNPVADGTGVGEKYLPVPQVDALPEVERDRAYQKLALQYISENPSHFAKLLILRPIFFWHLSYHGEGLAEVAFLLVYLPLLALAALGVRAAWLANRDATLLLLLVPLSLTIVHSIFLPVGRYRLPVELTLCMLAGVGANWSLKKMFSITAAN